eukprot:1819324-Rhodomonas_salina.1
MQIAQLSSTAPHVPMIENEEVKQEADGAAGKKQEASNCTAGAAHRPKVAREGSPADSTHKTHNKVVESALKDIQAGLEQEKGQKNDNNTKDRRTELHPGAKEQHSTAQQLPQHTNNTGQQQEQNLPH